MADEPALPQHVALQRKGIVLDGFLGKGSYAKVYRATRNSETIAVKIIDKGQILASGTLPLFGSNPAGAHRQLHLDMSDRVRTEVELHCKLRHDHIVRVLDIGEDGQHIFLMLEYVSLGNLQSYLQQRLKRALTEIEARSIVKQVRWPQGLDAADESFSI